MSSPTSRSAFFLGLRDALPMALVVFPFGMVFGVVATEAGLELIETMVFTSAVIAGASQLTGLHLMQDAAPLLIVLASALAVNLRMAMYSAAHFGQASLLRRALIAFFTVDQNYALCAKRFDGPEPLSLGWKTGYFAGTTVPTAPFWISGTLLGALVGDAIPEWLPLDFAVPITFVALIAPGLRTGAHRGAALVSAVLALAFAWLPYNLGLMVAGIGGMMTGAQLELILERRKLKKEGLA